jgi:glycosyltransferase involved in cell wall biosynthesis
MIIGITRVRNEEHIITDTLNHVSELVDMICVYDDASTDSTVKKCHEHPKVRHVIVNTLWEKEPAKRRLLEGTQRQKLYQAALPFNPTWIYYFDADEFADFKGIDFKADAYKLRLFDYYITEEDKNLDYRCRKWIGPEYRDITMLFRPYPGIRFTSRVPKLPNHYKVATQGSVMHFGKAISIKHWEETCKYYIHHRHPEGKKSVEKWKGRIGKAVHTKSDFGNDLIKWNERETKGIKLNEA